MAATAMTLSVVVSCTLRHSSSFLHIPRPPINTTNPISKVSTTTCTKLQAQQQQPRGFGPSTPNPNNNKWKQEDKKSVPKAANKEEEEDELPKAVTERISVRIVASVLIPMGLGLALLSGFGALKDLNIWDVPFWVPVATSFFTFGASALGIAYGALSSSWDPETKGSILGIEQLERNWIELWKK